MFTRTLLLAAALAAFWTGSAHTDRPAPATDPTTTSAKQPVPDEEAQAVVRQRLHKLYPKEYADRRSSAKRALADELLAHADDFTDPVELYVLLDEVHLLAADSGYVQTALSAVSRLADAYEVDASALTLSTLLALAENAQASQRSDMVVAVLDHIETCLTSVDAVSANALAEAIRLPTKHTKDSSLQFRFDAFTRQIEACQKTQEALTALQAEPSDPDANDAAGRYLCFWLGDFDRGLPLLARSPNEFISELAALDLSDPDDCAAQMRLARGWTHLADAAPPPGKAAVLERALEWAELARDQAEGLDSIRADQILADIAKREGRHEPQAAAPEEQDAEEDDDVVAVDEAASRRKPGKPSLPWADVLEPRPSKKIVTNPQYLRALEESGLPWHVRHKRSGIEMLLVPLDDEGRRFLYVGRYEVQEDEYDHVLDGARLSRGLDDPILQVGWDDLQAFLEEAGDGLRLPTPDEWEFACRAGTQGPHYANLEAIAWHRHNSGGHGHRVGEKEPNALGLYDMIGNAYEWTTDQMLRGGSWNHSVVELACTAHYKQKPGRLDLPGVGVGFRVVRDPE